MADVSIFNTLAPYHIIAYGTHLGAQAWQTFVSGITAYQTLERSQFSTLQQRVFPRYFTMQTAFPLLVALTYPGVGFGASSYHGVLAPANHWSVLYPLTTASSVSQIGTIVEAALVVINLGLFSYGYPEELRTALWEEGGSKGFNSDPKLRIYF
ncbi:hypothetical protein V491_03476 [Pseudogymnoascus sp. VKM F-3775]|nr:hypothetical protein V491_03476 [Pseudogymnoascus sp. VKM F-3775]